MVASLYALLTLLNGQHIDGEHAGAKHARARTHAHARTHSSMGSHRSHPLQNTHTHARTHSLLALLDAQAPVDDQRAGVAGLPEVPEEVKADVGRRQADGPAAGGQGHEAGLNVLQSGGGSWGERGSALARRAGGRPRLQQRTAGNGHICARLSPQRRPFITLWPCDYSAAHAL